MYGKRKSGRSAGTRIFAVGDYEFILPGCREDRFDLPGMTITRQILLAENRLNVLRSIVQYARRLFGEIPEDSTKVPLRNILVSFSL